MSDQKVSILGIPFINITLDKMIARLDEHIYENNKAFVVTANPEIVLAANEDEGYKKAILKADYITADGIGIVKAANLLGKPLPERVTGFDMFMSLLQLANEKQYSIYLLGARDEVLQKAVAEIGDQFPQVNVVGSHHGFFDWKDSKIDDEIREKKPDMVFVALGLPRQEKWIYEKIDSFDKGVFMGIGGSFDVLAGEVKRAPEIWQKLNVEWLYRLLKQPSRFMRMLALPKFALKILKEKVKN